MELTGRLDAARRVWHEVAWSDDELEALLSGASHLGLARARDVLMKLLHPLGDDVIDVATGEDRDGLLAGFRFCPADSATSNGCLDLHLVWTDGPAGIGVADLLWSARLVLTFSRLLDNGDKGQLLRGVRFWLGKGKGRAPACTTAIDIALGDPYSVLVDGVVGDVAHTLMRTIPKGENPPAVGCSPSARWTHLCACRDGVDELGITVTTLAWWWAVAQPEEVVKLCRRLDELFSQRIEEVVRTGQERTGMGRHEVFVRALSVVLAGLWQIRPLLGDAVEADEELEGWQREIEVSVRHRLNISSAAFGTEPIPSPARLTLPPGSPWHQVFVPNPAREVCGRRGAPHLAHTNEGGRQDARSPKRGLPAVPLDYFDGERTLAEVTLRLCFETPMPWERAAGLAAAWVRKEYILPTAPPDYTLPEPRSLRGLKGVRTYGDLPDSLEHERSRTILYFSYGSCMCGYSFKESVPQYELIGAAQLKGYRLAFTLQSTRRGGGAADIVPEPEGVVWGLLYRIPRKYLYRLDLREGVILGRYQRDWIEVDLCGARLAPVLTYSVVAKAVEEIAPSSEYAGLIWDGAYGMLDGAYCRGLWQKMDQFGVEPASPV